MFSRGVDRTLRRSNFAHSFRISVLQVTQHRLILARSARPALGGYGVRSGRAVVTPSGCPGWPRRRSTMYSDKAPVSWVRPGTFCVRHATVPPPPPQPPTLLLLDWLSRRYPKSKRQTLRRMVEAGRVTVNGTVARQ